MLFQNFRGYVGEIDSEKKEGQSFSYTVFYFNKQRCLKVLSLTIVISILVRYFAVVHEIRPILQWSTRYDFVRKAFSVLWLTRLVDKSKTTEQEVSKEKSHSGTWPTAATAAAAVAAVAAAAEWYILSTSTQWYAP